MEVSERSFSYKPDTNQGRFAGVRTADTYVSDNVVPVKTIFRDRALSHATTPLFPSRIHAGPE